MAIYTNKAKTAEVSNPSIGDKGYNSRGQRVYYNGEKWTKSRPAGAPTTSKTPKYNTTTGTNRLPPDKAKAATQHFLSGWLGAGYKGKKVKIGDYENGKYVGQGEDPRYTKSSYTKEDRDRDYNEREEKRLKKEERNRILETKYGVSTKNPKISGGTSLVKATFTDKGVVLLDDDGMPTGPMMSMDQYKAHREEVRANDWVNKFSTLGAQVTWDGKYYHAVGPSGQKYRSNSPTGLWKDLWAEAGGTPYSGNLWDPYPGGYNDPRQPPGDPGPNPPPGPGPQPPGPPEPPLPPIQTPNPNPDPTPPPEDRDDGFMFPIFDNSANPRELYDEFMQRDLLEGYGPDAYYAKRGYGPDPRDPSFGTPGYEPPDPNAPDPDNPDGNENQEPPNMDELFPNGVFDQAGWTQLVNQVGYPTAIQMWREWFQGGNNP